MITEYVAGMWVDIAVILFGSKIGIVLYFRVNGKN